MKQKSFILFLLLALLLPAGAQKYRFSFKVEGRTDSMMYIGRHFRDQFLVLDSTKAEKGTAVFSGQRTWDDGIYALLGQSRKDLVKDFMIEDSRSFSVIIPKEGPCKVSGSKSNKAYYDFQHAESAARAKAEKMLQDGDSVGYSRLCSEMEYWERQTIDQNQQYLFFRIQKLMRVPDVPDEAADKSVWYRTHYWDGMDFQQHELIYTPDLFNKMNYYFYGILFYSDKDTICRYTDLLLDKTQDDSTMMNYILEFVMPRYYRSTKKVGWDAVWCYLVENYYLKGRCPWATEGDLYSKRQTMEFLKKSLIGARGAELWMADTNQSTRPQDWISSHRHNFPYVILWFWDPDCHHCQEQTTSLKVLYDSLSAAHCRPFEVYAVGYESDVEKWKQYVKDHNLPFVNVGGPNVNIDYQEAYNVHGAPTMIILNHKREIIMNKTLPTDAIIPFLEDYEKKNGLDFGWRKQR